MLSVTYRKQGIWLFHLEIDLGRLPENLVAYMEIEKLLRWIKEGWILT